MKIFWFHILVQRDDEEKTLKNLQIDRMKVKLSRYKKSGYKFVSLSKNQMKIKRISFSVRLESILVIC